MRKLLLIALLSAALAGCGQGEPAASQADASSQLPAASSQAASEPVVLEPVAPDVSSAVSSQPAASAPPQAVSAAPSQSEPPAPSTASGSKTPYMENQIPNTDGTYPNPDDPNEAPAAEPDDSIMDYNQKVYDFQDYCDAMMDPDVYGGCVGPANRFDKVVTVYYLENSDPVRAVAEQYQPGWDGEDRRYVDEPIQIVYERADYSMTYLRQVRQEIFDELVRQGFGLPADNEVSIRRNRVNIVLYPPAYEAALEFLKTYPHTDCIGNVTDASALPPWPNRYSDRLFSPCPGAVKRRRTRSRPPSFYCFVTNESRPFAASAALWQGVHI